MNHIASLKLAIVEYKTLSGILHEDVNLARKQYFDAPSQSTARTLIRSVFALIEGQTYRLKQWALERYRQSNRIADSGELSLLEDVAFDINEKGKVMRRAARIRTAANVRFSFEAMARAYDFDYEFSEEDLGWVAFQQALAVRHRLTHPKSASDLNVEDDEVVFAMAAVEWFHHSSVSLLIEAVRSMSTHDSNLISNLQIFESQWKVSSEMTRSLLMSKRPKSLKKRSNQTDRKGPAD